MEKDKLTLWVNTLSESELKQVTYTLTNYLIGREYIIFDTDVDKDPQWEDGEGSILENVNKY